MGSDNPYVRIFGMMAQNTRTIMRNAAGEVVTQSRTYLEEGISRVNANMATVLVARRNGFTRFALQIGTNDRITFGNGIRAMVSNRALKMEFDRRVIRVLRGGVDNDAAVTETARALRVVLDDMVQNARNLQIPGLQFLEPNYFPRLWRWDVIRDIAARQNGRQDLVNLLTDALSTGGTRAAPLRRFRHADGTVEEFDDVADAAVVLADNLIRIANRADGAVLTETDREIAEAMDHLLGPMAQQPRTIRSHRFRGRNTLNEGSQINASADYFNRGNTNLHLDDLTDMDLSSVMKKYLVSTQGEINEHQMVGALNRFLVNNRIYRVRGAGATGAPQFVQIERLTEWLDLANARGLEMGLQPASSGTQQAMRTLIGALRFEPVQHANNELRILNELGQDVASVVLPLVYMAKGGMFALNAVGELSRSIATTGLRQFITQMPTLAEMVTNWRNMDEGTMNFAMLVDQAFHPATDRLRRTLYQNMPGEEVAGGFGAVTPIGRARRAVRGTLDRATNMFADTSMLAPVTSFSQQMMATSLVQHLYDVSRGTARRMDDITIRSLGLDPAQYDTVVRFVGNTAETRQFLAFDRVVNLRQLAGPEFDLLRGFIDRGVRTRIQDVPTRGDFHDLAFSFMGKIFTQFRTFSLKSVDNFLFQNASRIRYGDAQARTQVALEISAAILTGSIITYCRQLVAWQSANDKGDKKLAKEIEKRLGVEGFIKGGLYNTGEFYLPGMFADNVMEHVVDPVATGFGHKDTFLNRPMFSPYEFSQSGILGTPAGSFFESVGKVTQDILKQDFNQSTLHNLRLMSIGQNFYPLSRMYDWSEKELVDTFNLRKRSGMKK
jgi:hypothetical protein